MSRNDELYHYGRKGMKWYQNIFTKGKSKTSSTAANRGTKKEKPKKVSLDEKIKGMSDEELRKAVNRLNLERQYKKLVSDKRTTKGKTAVKKALSKEFNNIVMSVVEDSIRQELKSELNKQIRSMTKR